LVAFGVGMTIQMFLPCFFATKIQTASELFLQDAMEIDWIDFSMPDKKLLLFLMHNISKPNTIMSLKLFYLNNETFLTVC